MAVTIQSDSPSTVTAHRSHQTWWRRIRWGNQLAAYSFLAPALILFAVFAWLPILKTVIFSFQNVNLNGDSTWVGFDNIQRMLSDPKFGIAWGNALQFALLSLAMGYFTPILVAIMVAELRRGKAFFRLVYFLPTVIPITISLLIWRLIYKVDGGFLNGLIGLLNIPPQSWLQDARLAKAAIILILTWANFGATLLIYIAALADIPAAYYEAAELDGATPFQRIVSITLPQLYPTMIITFILQIIAVAQIFTEPFLLTAGGPGTATLTPLLVIYNKAFLNFDFGLAPAWSLHTIIILSIFSAIYLRFTRRTT